MHGSLSRLADLSRDGGMLVRARTWRGGVGKEGAEHQNYSIVHTRAVLFSHVLASRVVACARARSHVLTYLSLVTYMLSTHRGTSSRHSFIPGLGCTSPNRRVKWRGPTAAMSSTPIGFRMSPMILAIKRTKLSYAWHVMVMRVSAVPPYLPTCVHVMYCKKRLVLLYSQNSDRPH